MNLDLFTCEICQKLPSSPLVLSCCNCLVCRPCILNISFPCDNVPNRNLFNCPVCFKQNDDSKCGYESALLTKTLRNLREGNKINPADEFFPEKKCNRCDISIDNQRVKYVFCATCSGSTFCETCSKEIHAVGRFRDHLMIDHLPMILRSKVLNTYDSKPYYGAPKCMIHDQPLDSICLRDYSYLCVTCIASHKVTCKTSLIKLGEADSEIAYQLMLRNENLSSKRKLLDKEKENYKNNLDLMNKTFEETKKNILNQFNEFREALFVKEKELVSQLEISLEKRKFMLEKELSDMEFNYKNIEGLCSALNFACNSTDLKNLDTGLFFLLSKSESLLAAGMIPSTYNITTLNNRLESQFQINTECLEECKTLLFSININDNLINYGAYESKTGGMRGSSSQNLNNVSSSKKLRSVTPKRKNKPQIKNSLNNSLLGSQIVKSFEMTQSQLMGTLSQISDRGSLLGPPGATQNANQTQAQTDNKLHSLAAKKINISDLIIKKKDSKTDFNNQINTSDNLKVSISTLTNEEASTEDLNASGFFKNESVHGAEESIDLYKNNTNNKALADYRCRSREMSPMIKVPGLKMNEGHIRSQTPMDITRMNKATQPSQIKNLVEVKDIWRQVDMAHYNELIKNPLAKRVITKKLCSSNSIYLAWSYSTQHNSNIIYQVEYGIGTKVNGKEQFRKVYEGNNSNCILTDLQPKTTYRVRVRAVLMRDNIEESSGDWSDVNNITLYPAQAIDLQTCGTHAALITKNNEKYVQFDKSGLVTACNDYTYGKVCWEVKLQLQSAHISSDDCSCIKLGVTNKTGKIFTVIGSTFNYGLNKNQNKFKLILDFDKGTLTICSQTNPIGEIFNNLPPGPLFPAFQNKMGKNSAGSSIKLIVNFDMK